MFLPRLALLEAKLDGVGKSWGRPNNDEMVRKELKLALARF